MEMYLTYPTMGISNVRVNALTWTQKISGLILDVPLIAVQPWAKHSPSLGFGWYIYERKVSKLHPGSFLTLCNIFQLG